MSYVDASPRLPRLSQTAIASLARLDPALASAMQDYFRETEQVLEKHAHAINGSADAGVEELYAISANVSVGQTWGTVIFDELAYRDETADQFGYNPSTGVYTVPEGASALEISANANFDFDTPNAENQYGFRVSGTSGLATRIFPAQSNVVPRRGFTIATNIGIPQFPVEPGETFYLEAFATDGSSGGGTLLKQDPGSNDRYSWVYWRAFY